MQVNLSILTDTNGHVAYIGANGSDSAAARTINMAARLLERLDALDLELFERVAAEEECAKLADALKTLTRQLQEANA